MKVSAVLYFRKKEDKTGYVKICISRVINKKKQRNYIATPYTLTPSYWNKKAGKAWKTPNADSINNYLETEIKRIQMENGLEKPELTKERDSSYPYSFLEYLQIHIEDLLNKHRIGEYERYKALKNKMIAFLKTKNKVDFEFDDVDLPFLTAFDTYVRSTVNAQSTVHGYIKKFGTVYRKCIKVGKYVPKFNPFDFFENKTGESKAYALSLEQLKVFEKYSLFPKDISIDSFQALNLFLFQFYAGGLRVGDALGLRWRDISGVEIVANIRKSKKTSKIPFKGNPKVVNILRYYVPTEYKISYLKRFEDPVMEFTLSDDEAERLDLAIRRNYEVNDDGTFTENARFVFDYFDDSRLSHLMALYSEISMSKVKNYHIFPYITEDTSKMSPQTYYDLIGTRTTKYNKQLKSLMPLIRTNISLTSHVARHTYASIARKTKNVDVHTISELLVHKSVAQTQAYLDSIASEELNDFRIAINNSF